MRPGEKTGFHHHHHHHHHYHVCPSYHRSCSARAYSHQVHYSMASVSGLEPFPSSLHSPANVIDARWRTDLLPSPGFGPVSWPRRRLAASIGPAILAPGDLFGAGGPTRKGGLFSCARQDKRERSVLGRGGASRRRYWLVGGGKVNQAATA